MIDEWRSMARGSLPTRFASGGFQKITANPLLASAEAGTCRDIGCRCERSQCKSMVGRSTFRHQDMQH